MKQEKHKSTKIVVVDFAHEGVNIIYLGTVFSWTSKPAPVQLYTKKL